MLEALTGSSARVVKLVPGATAFFVCDIQERFRPVIHAYDSVINTAAKMTKAAALLEVPVIVTEQNPKALGATVPLSLEKLPKSLYRGAISKTKFSMMLPEVEAQLKEWKTKSVVIFGIESHVCVLQTCLDLLERNYSVHILADGVSSCNQGEVGVALARMQASGAQITTSESALFQLMVDSSHPAFRQVSALVKETKATTTSSLETLLQGKGKL
ncbi:BZ3500_MvSof-1268-A1-R1_Chr1-3g01837 [Microbotryum saponariae]|uniref:BZ3500_MvSof-1268-A1-R1_Chr1-3g01837 protein n=1 Tax=Microbotryum saponariae TaxID=289078 RepID=A0A2X0KM37_9BASI|nr:BZ3500_MvSof-1268-A1-R1_Chr1-3g01837 [Microbotryum saponariae]SCZ94719.1 BZ3501_MvSof-1269-A2-R1_Chr1-3g01439 [Microbotryum saponariae]